MPGNNITTPLFNGSGGSLVKGNVIRMALATNKFVTKAQANSAAGVQGLIGVVETGVIPNGGVASISLFGLQFVLLETGLTPAAGNTLYVSSSTAGVATTAAPASNAIAIGTITDASGYAATGGVMVNINPSLVPVSSSSGGGSVADWTLGITRVYAVDGVNGNDSNLGYADPASTSTADYQIACALAGTRAKKTIAGLRAIFPMVGAARNVEIVWANGGVNTVFNYNGALRDAIGGAVGYAALETRATGTNTTAGCVAFDGSAADCLYMGALTATGMNVAGYSPTGVPTTTTMQCTLFGGGAPGFAAEAAATLPMGACIRFNSSAATAALQNVRRMVSKIAGTDTLTWTPALPATPTAGDTFYLEMPGAQFTTCGLGPSMTSGGNANVAIAGLQFTTSCIVSDGRFTFGFCWGQAMAASGSPSYILSTFYGHPVRGNVTCGASRATTTLTVSAATSASVLACVGTTFTASSPSSLTINPGFVAANVNISGVYGQNSATANIGGTTALASVAPRILSSSSYALLLSGGGGVISIYQIEIQQSAGAGLMAIQNQGWNVSLANSVTGTGTITGTAAGAGSYGLDMFSTTNGAPSGFNIVNVSDATPPTITGASGDIRLGSGAMSWSTIVSGQIGMADVSGNRFNVRAAASNGAPLLFSGTLIGSGGGATFTYLCNRGTEIANTTAPYNFPATGFSVSGIYCKPRTNTMAGTSVVALYKNNVLQYSVNITGGSTAVVGQGPVGGFYIQFAGGSTPDLLDIRVSRAAADAGVLDVSVAVNMVQ